MDRSREVNFLEIHWWSSTFQPLSSSKYYCFSPVAHICMEGCFGGSESVQTERCPSGLRCSSRKAVNPWFRGFESHSLRHINTYCKLSLPVHRCNGCFVVFCFIFLKHTMIIRYRVFNLFNCEFYTLQFVHNSVKCNRSWIKVWTLYLCSQAPSC